MSNDPLIKVTSHVSRDFLQNSAYFNTLAKVVWEYVANSLDATKEGMQAIVAVDITSKFVRVSDNGRGMSRADLRQFFQMHGENQQRKSGKLVRGRFGTGKSAAFGLANQLLIDTTKMGKRNVVELYRSDIEEAHGDSFPVRDVAVDEATQSEDGTTVEIRDFNTSNLDVERVIPYIERHLSRYRSRAHVTINGHECHFAEPQSVEQYECRPPADVETHLGPITLSIKVSPVPLDEETRGIDILSHGIWHGTTLAGIEQRERANYLFGDVEVPILEDREWPIPPFDNTRNNTLNHQNPAVAVLLGWLKDELEVARLELVRKERERRKTETAQQLAKEADQIAEILNDDLIYQELELELAQRVALRSGERSVNEILDDQGDLMPGSGSLPTGQQQTGAPHGNGKRGSLAGRGNIPRPGPDIQAGNDEGAHKSPVAGSQKRRKAAFSIEFVNETAETERSRYDSSAKKIYINLDHPQIAHAFEAGGRRTDVRQFRELCYEAAVVEYAIAVAHEKVEKTQLNVNASDVLYDVKDTINRLLKRFANLFSDTR